MKYHILKNAIKLLIVRSLPTVCEIGNFFPKKCKKFSLCMTGPKNFQNLAPLPMQKAAFPHKYGRKTAFCERR